MMSFCASLRLSESHVVLAQPLTPCVTLGKISYLSGTQFPLLKNEGVGSDEDWDRSGLFPSLLGGSVDARQSESKKVIKAGCSCPQEPMVYINN